MTARLRFAVVGLGFGANHARVLSEMKDADLVAVCDAQTERLEQAGATWGVKTYTDVTALLRGESLDAVIVAVPASDHSTVALQAIRSGCAVLVEKPIAPSLAEGRRLVQAAAGANVVFMPGHIERFNPVVVEAKRQTSEGRVGRVLRLTARRLAYFSDRRRRVDIGVVHDLAIHEIDVMRHLAEDEVTEVFARAQFGVRTPFEDSVSALLTFGDEERQPATQAMLDVHWLSPRKVRTLEVLGTEGELALDYDAKSLLFQPCQSLARSEMRRGVAGEAALEMSGEIPQAATEIAVETREPLAEELAAFAAAIRGDVESPLTGRDALAALRVADALLESAKSGQPVKLSREK